jgi:monoterpene epsilon-lactone hydrolase
MAHTGIDLIRQMLGDAGLDDGDIYVRRASLEALAGSVPAPDGVAVEPTTLGGRPAEWIVPEGVGRERVVLYLHGGGYCEGSLNTHRNLAGRIALATQCAVCALDYRLAPEHPFPAAVDDASAAYRQLIDDGGEPDSIAIAGDSAGGGLTVATLLALRDGGDLMPAAAVCLSPWVDLTQSSGTYETRADLDPMCTREGLTTMADAYLVDTDPTTPLASPAFADLSDLPPLMIEVGDDEVLLADSMTLADRARAAGVEVDLTIWTDMIHVFHAFPGELVPESDESLAAIGTFLRSHLT